jgi:hypothetical protein
VELIPAFPPYTFMLCCLLSTGAILPLTFTCIVDYLMYTTRKPAVINGKHLNLATKQLLVETSIYRGENKQKFYENRQT